MLKLVELVEVKKLLESILTGLELNETIAMMNSPCYHNNRMPLGNPVLRPVGASYHVPPPYTTLEPISSWE